MPIQPISTLTPNLTRWTIRAKVSQKSGIRKFKNANTDGRLFSMTLRDEEGGEIRCTGFTTEVERFYEIIEEGKTYEISGGTLKTANQKFNTCKNPYELTLSGVTKIEASKQMVKTKLVYDFVTIESLAVVAIDETVDLCAVAVSVGSLHKLMTKRKITVEKRMVTLRDATGEIDLTIWGNTEAFVVGSVIVARGLKVGEYHGPTVSSTFTSSIEIDPDMQEAEAVRASVDVTLSQVVTIASLMDSPADMTVDLCAMVVSVGPIVEHKTRRETMTIKRSVTLRDATAEIELTLWAQDTFHPVGSVVAARRLKLSDFNGRSVSSTFKSTFEVDPQIPDATDVRMAMAEGCTVARITDDRAPRMTISNILTLGTGAKVDRAELKAMVTSFRRDSFSYMACPETNKKCIEQEDGRWLCEATQQEYERSEVSLRFTLSLTVHDSTGFQSMMAFDGPAHRMMGLSAEALSDMDSSARQTMFSERCFHEYIFRLRCRVEVYDDKETLKCNIDNVCQIDYAAESKKLLVSINRMLK
jgi:ssDNA-binding replication factor A large subunit